MSSFCAYLLHQSLVTTILTGRSFLPNLTQSRCVMTKVGKMPAKRELKTARFRHSSISESFLYVASENFIPHILNSIEIHIWSAMNNSYKQENLEPDDRKSVKQKKRHYTILSALLHLHQVASLHLLGNSFVSYPMLCKPLTHFHHDTYRRVNLEALLQKR